MPKTQEFYKFIQISKNIITQCNLFNFLSVILYVSKYVSKCKRQLVLHNPVERGMGLDVFERLYSENVLFIKYYVMNMCGSIHTAEEIVQETFYKTFLYIKRFEDVSINRQWLIKTAHNTFIDHYRKFKNETNSVSLDVLSEINCLSREIGIYVNSYEESIIINKIISELPVSYRTVILLKDHYGFSIKEIACILGYSESNAKVVLHRARKHFRKEYSKYEG